MAGLECVSDPRSVTHEREQRRCGGVFEGDVLRCGRRELELERAATAELRALLAAARRRQRLQEQWVAALVAVAVVVLGAAALRLSAPLVCVV